MSDIDKDFENARGFVKMRGTMALGRPDGDPLDRRAKSVMASLDRIEAREAKLRKALERIRTHDEHRSDTECVEFILEIVDVALADTPPKEEA